jgi:NAD(P)-dependent dehydrogenase (short-subunit alcohol dehydrogenase family)
MKKSIFITGATDGIGLATAKLFAEQGHNLLIHGRNVNKLNDVANSLRNIPNSGSVKSYVADLSVMCEVKSLAEAILSENKTVDVIINNAGVLKAVNTVTQDGLDVRFVVNMVAPFILTKKLLPLLDTNGRVVNVSSAAQAPVNIKALIGETTLSDMEAYSQSKLGLINWTRKFAEQLGKSGPTMISVNPGSLLGSKMVKEGFGVSGGDIKIGANILVNMALKTDVDGRSGEYFDNDLGQFSAPHPDGMNLQKSDEIVTVMNNMFKAYT